MKFERYSKINVVPNYITIKKSNIINAGLGAFTNVDIPKGTTIGEYIGKIYTGKEMEKTNGDYLFSVRVKSKDVKIIDGKNKEESSWVRYVNSPLKFEDGNAHFYQYSKRIFLKTRKDIPANNEILAYYGDDYVNEKLK